MPGQSVYSIVRSGLRFNYGEVKLEDFSGGLNIRDAANQLAANETPDCYNITLDERGGAGKRLGMIKYNGSPFQAALISNKFYWPSGQNEITQCGDKLYKDTGASFKTFTTTERCGMCDFKGLLIFIHPTDGLFKYDGTTVTAIAAGPKGNTITSWQNKLWAAGDPTAGAKPRVYFCAAGDETSWPGTNFVDLREKDTEAVVCLTGASGIDVSGRPGLLAYKKRSLYRIFDSSTGAFQTLDTQIGAAGPLAVTNGYQRTVALGEKGIWWTDGVGPMRPASSKLDPLFAPAFINFAKLDLVAAGAKGTRMYFSLPRAGSTANDLELEYHPLQGWIVANSSAASCYATYGKDDEKLLVGSPTVNGQAYERFKGGSDDGAAITSRFQTRWVAPTSGHPCRIARVRISGRGTVPVDVLIDYSPNTIENFVFVANAGGALYDAGSSLYDSSVYAQQNFQDSQDFPLNDVINAISLVFRETSSVSATGQPILGSGAAPELGAWGAYQISFSYRPLGLG
jgi:hypothetical protein